MLSLMKRIIQAQIDGRIPVLIILAILCHVTRSFLNERASHWKWVIYEYIHIVVHTDAAFQESVGFSRPFSIFPHLFRHAFEEFEFIISHDEEKFIGSYTYAQKYKLKNKLNKFKFASSFRGNEKFL